MGAFRLPFAISCTILVPLSTFAAYIALVQSLSGPEEAPEECNSAADNDERCNSMQQEETSVLIQVLSAVVSPESRKKDLKGAPFVEKEVRITSSSSEAEVSMNLFARFVKSMKSKVNSLLGYAEEPEKVPIEIVYPAHPLWKPEWHRMLDRGALRAGLCLFIGGVICTAGGIGGGGIYVTVLMFFGELSVHDAIPMSKVVVFAASLPSLILNLSKSIVEKEGSAAKSLIDYNVCRIVVPWALIGTLLGVYWNRHVDGTVIVGLLCVILIGMTALICRKGWEQHCEEEKLEEEQQRILQKAMGESPQDGSRVQDATIPADSDDHSQAAGEGSLESDKGEERPLARNTLLPIDMKLAGSALLLVIFCGTMRYHTVKCIRDGDGCTHPIAEIISVGQLNELKNHTQVLEGLQSFILFVPVIYCSVIAAYYSHGCVKSEDDWSWCRVASYSLMAITTGALAGLVGIGGGLIFAPFFIQMGMDPHVAVASSSTCVIFTSSSTTFQYLFTDRIIVALIFSFGIPHLMAAYTGTKLVHFIQDNYGTKKSWITWIVAFGVGISTLLAIHKMFHGDTAVH